MATHVVFENGYLRPLTGLTYHHHAVNRFASRQKLRLGQDRRPSPSLLASLASPLLLCLESS